jgi:hypothetical protein
MGMSHMMAGHTIFFGGSFSGSNESKPTMSYGSGKVEAALEGHLMIIAGYYKGLGSKVDAKILGGSHVHLGAKGVSGPIVFVLTNTGGTAGTLEGTFYLTSKQIKELMAGDFYVNIHTLNNPAGAIRAQLDPMKSGMGMSKSGM